MALPDDIFQSEEKSIHIITERYKLHKDDLLIVMVKILK